MMRVSQRKLFAKNQEKTVGRTAVMSVTMGKCFAKKFPLPSEKTDTESKSESSTTETSDYGSGRENESQRKWYQ